MKLVPTVEAGILCPDAAEVECIARQLAANGFKGFASEIRRLWVEFDQAQSRIAELEKDAARYRWLRENAETINGPQISWHWQDEHRPFPPMRDLAEIIDAAL